MKVLFLCTGNSCRSQMAEGWGKHLYATKGISFYSAGTIKSQLNPFAKEVMAEMDVDISGQHSKDTDEIKEIAFDYVFTVCDHAHENCPYFPGGKVVHVGFDDPPFLTRDYNSDEEKLMVYRRVRDEIKQFVETIETYFEKKN